MNKRILIFLKFLVIISICGCIEQEEPVAPKDYPILITEKVTSIDASGVVVSATILAKGKDQITKIEFMWEEDRNQSQSFKQIIHVNPDTTERIELKISSDLRKGGYFKYRAYLEVEDVTVLGNEESFISEGSLPPKINDFYPKSGDIGDIITIVGENFSTSRARTVVWIGKERARLIYVSMDTIRVEIPEWINASGDVELSLRSGIITTVSAESIFLEGYRILSFSPESGIIGETEVIISGTGFDRPIDEITVKLGGQELEVIEANFSEIKVKTPYRISDYTSRFLVEIDGESKPTLGPFRGYSRWRNYRSFSDCPKLLGEAVGGYVFGGANSNCSQEKESEVFTSNLNYKVSSFPGSARQAGISFF